MNSEGKKCDMKPLRPGSLSTGMRETKEEESCFFNFITHLRIDIRNQVVRV